MGSFGVKELLLVLLIVLLLFGGSRLPQLARAIGSSMREFKQSVKGGDEKDGKQDKGGE